MKKIVYTIIYALLPFLISGCENELDTKNLYEKDLDSFYSSPKDIDEAMNGVYSALYVDGIFSEEFCSAGLMDDCMLGGGGPDDVGAKNVDQFLDPAEDTYRSLWIETYNGVYRANAIIEAVQTKDFSSYFETKEQTEEFLNNTLGEAYFMRGFLMYRAARFFGGMPIIPAANADRKVPRASFTETFSFIAENFLKAIEHLPRIKGADLQLDEYGHANLWVAKAYLARTYLFYTGYMTNLEGTATAEIPLTEGSLTKAQVVKELEDVRDNSGYELTPNYRNLWPYAYVNENAKNFDANYDPAKPPLPWADKLGLKWVGQDGPKSTIGTGNKEVMFALRFGLANWSIGQKYNNRYPLFFGIRGNSMVPFGEGWGWGTVHTAFYDSWTKDDLRKEASVIDLTKKSADEGTSNWQSSKGDQETGLVNRKYTTLQHNGKDGVKGLFFYLYKMVNGDPMQLWAAQDFYYLRFSDIYLMHSELTETADGINKVRARVSLPPVAYSLDALKNERKYEFAFEGLRWFDLVRWGDVNNENKNYFGIQIDVNNSGSTGKYKVSYRPETKGLVALPESEIRLSNGVYTQNPGW
ncbi:MAG TPA: RagB/SusD family nutrient uptake outer membrane protein [Dysgonomonas sp.]|uniref:RagB/SusD family nutrient uptake outer membrane protein n=1 Tax=unclassified Dysgonomonas TaxID=2630389 RepID=UPI0025BF432C|nr:MULTISPECIES: RagB/SusD family nutrient uptake outer membrane protein [unclassified Dysgonomonas]HML65029.1 RagB/SusD family nutrient uptake outer membrane protein [Dysgonomonas sp.]